MKQIKINMLSVVAHLLIQEDQTCNNLDWLEDMHIQW